MPFFATGLAENQRCLWVTSAPLGAEQARAALAAGVSDLDARIEAGQIEILDHEAWYLRSGEMSNEAVVRSWLDAEARAIADGYEGLRLSGNTSWLPATGWTRFSAYEHAVHRAFRGRRIVALCSYLLNDRTDDELVELMRSHDLALVPREQGWRAVRTATEALAAFASTDLASTDLASTDLASTDLASTDLANAPVDVAPTHTVRMFHEHEYPAARVAEYLCEPLEQGHAALAFGTAPHLEQLSRALEARGVDVDGGRRSGRVIFADANEIAAAVIEQGPSSSLFEERVGALVRGAAARYGRARVYGEIVDVLAARERLEIAVALEALWNGLLASEPVELLCGYSFERFAAAHTLPDFRRVCGAHAHVEAAGERPRVGSDGRLLAELQQTQFALEGETSRRARLDEERARLLEQERAQRIRAEAASRHLARLQALTAALAETTSIEQVREVLSSELEAALGPGTARIVLAAQDGSLAIDPRDGAIDASEPILDAYRDGNPSWADAGEANAIPLFSSGHCIGVLAWIAAHPLALAQRALLEDCAQQISVAIDRALLHEAANRERRRAEAAMRAKDDFLAMLGHELRNPLSPMLIAVELMRLRGDGSLSRECAVIDRQVGHLVRLVDDLLDVSRIARGKVVLVREPTEIARVVTEAAEIARPALEERAQELVLDVPRGLSVHADRARLVQVIVNLLTNASKFSPVGAPIDITATADGAAVSVSVRDRGIGIDPALLPSIFDSFVQGPQAADRPVSGLGLGLAIASNLTWLHGGALKVDSEGCDRGSTFTLELPLMQSPEQVPRAAEDVPAREPSRRALVVDDNEDAATLLGAMLEAWGHEVRVAYDGPAALVLAEKLRPEIALLDVGLPGMDGHELAGRLAELLSDSPPTLVAVTGYGQEVDRRRSHEAGFAHHLVKPVAPLRLRELIAELSPATPADRDRGPTR